MRHKNLEKKSNDEHFDLLDFQKCSRIPKCLKTCEAVKFDLIFHFTKNSQKSDIIILFVGRKSSKQIENF